MNRKIKKILLRTATTIGFCLTLLIGIVLNPNLLYAHSTDIGTVTVYHNNSLPNEIGSVLNDCKGILQTSELYDASFGIDLCLNDGSKYPKLVRLLKGPAFAHGFYNKVVITSDADFHKNTSAINGRQWNLTELITHEMLHCFQYNEYGLSTLSFPMWKLEGYPEYISRSGKENNSLQININTLLKVEATDNEGWIDFNDGTGSTLLYYKDRLLIQYLMEVKNWTYDQIIEDETSRESVETEMMKWYENKVFKLLYYINLFELNHLNFIEK